jgi:hypothetical protein
MQRAAAFYGLERRLDFGRGVPGLDIILNDRRVDQDHLDIGPLFSAPPLEETVDTPVAHVDGRRFVLALVLKSEPVQDNVPVHLSQIGETYASGNGRKSVNSLLIVRQSLVLPPGGSEG